MVGYKLLYILGNDVVRVVQDLRLHDFRYKVSDSRFGQADVDCPTPDMAGLREFAVLDVVLTAKMPATLTHDQVATLPVSLVISSLFTVLWGSIFHNSSWKSRTRMPQVSATSSRHW